MMVADNTKTSRPEARRRGLGRGLSSLIGEEALVPTVVSGDANTDRSSDSLPVELIHPGQYQPRTKFDEDQIEALAQSIRENGVLQPIIVRRDSKTEGHFEIIAGERRWRAAQRAQLHEIPVLIRDLNDEAVLEIALVENVQRQDLSPLEEAEGYRRLIDQFKYTQENLAKKIGKSRVHITNSMRLLSLPEAVRSMLDDGRLSAGHGRALLGVENAEDLAQQIIEKGLNVRQTEKLARAEKEEQPGKSKNKNQKRTAFKDPDTVALEKDLSEKLGLSVEINSGEDGQGTLVLKYQSFEQLDDVLQKLN